MPFCSKCGKEYQPGTKFCTGCGNALVVVQPVPEYMTNDDFPAKKGNTRKHFWIWVVSLVFVAAVASYFIFFKSSNTAPNVVSATDTTTIAPEKTASTSTNPTVVSKPVSLNANDQTQYVELSEYELNEVSSNLRSFYENDNSQNIDGILGHYTFPVKRYYHLYNVSYNELYKIFYESFFEKLSYHYITIKWEQSTVQKVSDGYRANLLADYDFIRTNSPDISRNRSIRITVMMNNNFKITHVFEN